MAEFAERSPSHVAAAPAKVERAEESKGIHPRQVIHAAILVILFGFYSWPFGSLVNGMIEPRIFGFPFYVFWVLFLIPALSFINLVIYARFMLARERQLKAENPKRAVWE